MIEYPELSNLLDNKNVIVVGRSKYLFDTHEYPNQGEFIDSHDIVVRINNPLPYIWDANTHSFSVKRNQFYVYIHDSWKDKIGSRVDIHHLSILKHEWGEHTIEKFVKAGCQVVTAVSTPTLYRVKQHIDVIKRYTSYCTIPLSSFIKTHYDYRNSYKDAKYMKSGIIVVSELLKCNIKSLHIIGFTSFQLKEELEYKRRLLQPSKMYHTLDSDILWLKDKFETDSRLKTGVVLQSIFDNIR